MSASSGSDELDYVEQVGALPPDRLLLFYELLAHNLTVSVRAVWSDEALSDPQKIEKMKWLNEIMHQVTSKISALRRNENAFSEADTWDMFRHYGSQCPDIKPDIAFATIASYQAATR